MLLKKFLIVIILMASSCFSFACPGDSLAKQINQAIHSFYHNHAVEKVYLHCDKTNYQPGENIWFKAYVTSNSIPSTISKVLYVDLLDQNQGAVEKLKIQIEKSTANGEISLPAKLVNGIYYIRSYTAWMLNFRPQLIFYKKIFIGSAAEKQHPKN